MSDTTDQTNLINHNEDQTTSPVPPPNDNNQGLIVPTSRTQYKLSRSEVVHGIANRIIYSRFYTWLYLGMTVLSLASIILSLIEECQTVAFIILEVIINTVMILEVITRLVAFRKLFWKSIYNTVDIILVLLCIITLIFILDGGCSHKSEEVFDLILLIARNLIQFSRLYLLLRKNKKTIKARNATVDFNNIRDPSFSVDIDTFDREFLDEEFEDDTL